ncbi:hypothetical protein, partial [Escherichia coli]|uniref:hypothetical protein n=1 Tax=Escherichia coli TaxID=562 RepID=UPI0013653686
MIDVAKIFAKAEHQPGNNYGAEKHPYYAPATTRIRILAPNNTKKGAATILMTADAPIKIPPVKSRSRATIIN